MIRKLPLIMLALVLVLVLAACGGESETDPTAAPTAVSQPEPTAEPPTEEPTEVPTDEPTAEPEPTEEVVPTDEPTDEPEPTVAAEATIDAPAGWPASVSDLPTGDAANGELLYVDKGCVGCHGDPATPGSSPLGPHHGNIGNIAGERVPGLSAAVYLYESILNPNAFIVPDCANDTPCADPSVMPANFAEQFSQQEVADLIAYMLGLIE